MRLSMAFSTSVLAFTLILGNGCVVAPPGPPPPPAPLVETYGVTPYPDGVWVGGAWEWHGDHRRYEWRHGEWRHRGWDRR